MSVGTPTKGVTVDPAAPVIEHGDTETKVTLKAAADASLGDFTVKVTGHPTKGGDGSTDLEITVAKDAGAAKATRAENAAGSAFGGANPGSTAWGRVLAIATSGS